MKNFAFPQKPEQPLRVYLDDQRETPGRWIRTYTAHETIDILKTGRVGELSLDHDLGDRDRVGDGYEVLNWIEEAVIKYGFFPPDIKIHTDNGGALANMLRAKQKIEHAHQHRDQSHSSDVVCTLVVNLCRGNLKDKNAHWAFSEYLKIIAEEKYNALLKDNFVTENMHYPSFDCATAGIILAAIFLAINNEETFYKLGGVSPEDTDMFLVRLISGIYEKFPNYKNDNSIPNLLKIGRLSAYRTEQQ